MYVGQITQASFEHEALISEIHCNEGRNKNLKLQLTLIAPKAINHFADQ